jgi:two-component system phosphate regulon sensor histidine kinase PhoR
MFDLPFRVWPALGIVVIAAAIVGAVASSLVGAAATLVFGAVAVLLAAEQEEEDEDLDAPPPPPLPQPVETVLDAIVAPVLVVQDGRIAIANRAARTLLGEHVAGEDARTAIRHPAAAERLTANLDGATLTPVDLVGIGTLDQRWQMHVTLVGDGTRVVYLVDQTGNYATERMRVDFVANASHELRTPLASILGYVETLSDEAGEDPALRQRFLRVVLDEAHRMQRLVEDLMSLSRIEAEKYRSPSAPVDLIDLVCQARDELAVGHAARDRAIEIAAEAPLPPVAGDRVQLSQMIHNLVGNALKYGAPGTPVSIIVALDGPRAIRLTVTDQGEGIAPEHLPRLTERFYRVDPGRSRSLGGTGLGLAIVKHIVERHRGRLDIASVVGKGTRVTVTLPVLDVIKA